MLTITKMVALQNSYIMLD